MTYATRHMDDVFSESGVRWAKGTLRVWHGDDRQYWSVTHLGDEHYGTSLILWDKGERFDGERWVPFQAGAMPSDRTCAECEYFDAAYGDCLSHNSDRFQTSANRPSCLSFFASTTMPLAEATPRFDREVERVADYPCFADSDGGECD